MIDYRGDIMNSWISVDDRLPLELSDDDHYKEISVLVTDGITVETCNFQRGSIGTLWREWGVYQTSFPTEDITHWMPLPEPPQGENK